MINYIDKDRLKKQEDKEYMKWITEEIKRQRLARQEDRMNKSQEAMYEGLRTIGKKKVSQREADYIMEKIYKENIK